MHTLWVIDELQIQSTLAQHTMQSTLWDLAAEPDSSRKGEEAVTEAIDLNLTCQII
jgi:hypothetical protein